MNIEARPFFVLRTRGRIERGRPRFLGTRRVGFMHAHKDGSPVLIEGSGWRTINGIYGNFFGGYFTFVFRRFWG
jgi:hypothetical protein